MVLKRRKAVKLPGRETLVQIPGPCPEKAESESLGLGAGAVNLKSAPK